MFGFLFGLGASLIGSLISRPKRPAPAPPPPPPPPRPPPPPPPPPPQIVKVVQTQQKTDLKTLVKDSEEAGFNPLTVLRNGGIAGWQVNQTPFLTSNPAFVSWQQDRNDEQRRYELEREYQQQSYGHQLQVRQERIEYDNANRQWFGNFVSGIGGAFGQWGQQQQASRRYKLEDQLLLSEIARNNRSNQQWGQNWTRAPSAEWHRPGTGQGAVTPLSVPAHSEWERGDVTVTNPHPNGFVHPAFSDAEVAEARYGEVVSEVWGWSNAIADWRYNLARRNNSRSVFDPPSLNPSRVLPPANNAAGGGAW